MESGPRWAPGAFIFLVVMCLVYAVRAASHYQARVYVLEADVFAKSVLIDKLSQVSRLIVPAGPVRIVPVEVIHPRKHHDQGHDTPIFSPEWHYEVRR